MKCALAVALGFMLAACAQAGSTPGSPTATPSSDPLAQIAKFTIADLQAADADAVAHNDVLAHACYPALIQFVQQVQGNQPGGTVAGAFSAFQKARDLRLGVQTGLPTYLKLGCAPLVQDETLLLVRLGAIGAGAAVVGPAAPALIPSL